VNGAYGFYLQERAKICRNAEKRRWLERGLSQRSRPGSESIQDNIRRLIEQAAAASGAESEALVSDRIAQQTEELERLTHQRDTLAKKTG
jgi:hypothetical protein